MEAPVGVRVVAAGDIACAPGEPVTKESCQHVATAALAKSLDPELVLTLGDTQYPKSSLADLRASYDKSWGGLLDRTRPTLGNHEYYTSGATGYYAYFKDRQPGPPGYYRFNIGGWKIYVLNSNCTKVSCAEEAAWMERGMKAYPMKCTIVTMHHPRYSSGSEHGNNTAVKPLWAVAYKHRNDIVLSGHDHDYEWFTRMDGLGHYSSVGMQSFVVGTGGKDLYHLGTRQARIEILPAQPARSPRPRPAAGLLRLEVPRHRRDGSRRGRPLLRVTRRRPSAGQTAHGQGVLAGKVVRSPHDPGRGTALNSDVAAREVATEQDYVDTVYSQMEKAALSAQELAKEGLARGRIGNEGGLVERDAMVFQAARRMATLDAAHEGLVFGRLDMGAQVSVVPRYIGRIGLRDDNYDVLLIDWRAPAAAVFYQATQADPQGVVRRRILRSKGVHVLGVEDDLLDPEDPAAETLPIVGEGALLAQLSRARDRSMHSIVATIQAEQDRAIRAPNKGVVSITGGPGTGKTVVALHRAAYLLYADRRRYETGGVLVVGPSGVFMRYIERVLPVPRRDRGRAAFAR